MGPLFKGIARLIIIKFLF